MMDLLQWIAISGLLVALLFQVRWDILQIRFNESIREIFTKILRDYWKEEPND